MNANVRGRTIYTCAIIVARRCHYGALCRQEQLQKWRPPLHFVAGEWLMSLRVYALLCSHASHFSSHTRCRMPAADECRGGEGAKG